MQLGRGDFHLLFALSKIYQNLVFTNNKMYLQQKDTSPFFGRKRAAKLFFSIDKTKNMAGKVKIPFYCTKPHIFG